MYVIPYVRGTVDMFGTPGDYTGISLELAVAKNRVSHSREDEFAAFLGDDWATWTGQEVGFRFPMNHGRDICTVYAQNPIWPLPWCEYPVKVENLSDYHVYTIEIKTWWRFRLAIYKIDGQRKVVYLLSNRRKEYLPVLCSHNHLDKDFDFSMKLKSIDTSWL